MNTTKNETTQTVRASVNERKLFETLGHMFATSFSIVGEVMQNARRAGATKVEFEASFQERRLEVIDNGCGISDFQTLIELATSGWTNEQVMLSEKPFGMGLFSLFYACEFITIRSRGQLLKASLEDIVLKRELHVIRDAEPVVNGTRILLSGLNEKLMGSAPYTHWKEYACGGKDSWQMYEAITNRAGGFDLPIILNGVPVPQPFARRNIGGQIASVGYVSVAGIHTKTGAGISIEGSNTQYFLQGLPIETSRRGFQSAGNVVHLDSERFIALMPDRANLQDADTQLESVRLVLKAILEQYLTEEKASLAPAEFVGRYFETACHNGFSRIFNDVPCLPASIFSTVSCVSYRHDDVWNGMLDQSQPRMVVTREELITGEVLAWRDTPSTTSDSGWAASLLKVMQRTNVADVRTDRLDPGHWIFDAVPSALDFSISATPTETKAAVEVSVNWEGGCSLILVDSIAVVITSTVNPSFRIEHEVAKDWLVVPVDPEDDSDGFSGATLCYFTPSDASNDHPACVFTDFEDERDSFMEDWQANDIARWNSLMDGLCGGSLTTTVQRALADASVEPTPNQCEHLTLVRLARTWNSWAGMTSGRRFDAIDLQGAAFWTAFAANLNLGGGIKSADMAEQLRRAFIDTAKPNELVIASVNHELAEAGGYKISGKIAESVYALLPGETKVELEKVDHNCMGPFSSREAAIEAVAELVVKDTCLWHNLSDDQWLALEFPEKYEHVRTAHAQRIVDAAGQNEVQKPTQSA